MNDWLPLYPSWVPEYDHQPAKRTMLTWDQLKASYMPNYDIILAPGQSPDKVVGHQFTGDRCLLPGVYDSGMTMNTILYKNRMPLDVSVFNREWIYEIGGGDILPIVPPVPTHTLYPAYVTLNACNVRSASYKPVPPEKDNLIGILPAGTQVIVDTNDTISGYSHIQPWMLIGFPAGGWVYSAYLRKV